MMKKMLGSSEPAQSCEQSSITRQPNRTRLIQATSYLRYGPKDPRTPTWSRAVV